MTTRSPQPPWEFLLSASKNSLQSYELSRLAHASNLRKEIVALVDQWMEETAAAMHISAPTVKREWAMAKAWLHRELSTT